MYIVRYTKLMSGTEPEDCTAVFSNLQEANGYARSKTYRTPDDQITYEQVSLWNDVRELKIIL